MLAEQERRAASARRRASSGAATRAPGAPRTASARGAAGRGSGSDRDCAEKRAWKSAGASSARDRRRRRRAAPRSAPRPRARAAGRRRPRRSRPGRARGRPCRSGRRPRAPRPAGEDASSAARSSPSTVRSPGCAPSRGSRCRRTRASASAARQACSTTSVRLVRPRRDRRPRLLAVAPPAQRGRARRSPCDAHAGRSGMHRPRRRATRPTSASVADHGAPPLRPAPRSARVSGDLATSPPVPSDDPARTARRAPERHSERDEHGAIRWRRRHDLAALGTISMASPIDAAIEQLDASRRRAPGNAGSGTRSRSRAHRPARSPCPPARPSPPSTSSTSEAEQRVRSEARRQSGGTNASELPLGLRRSDARSPSSSHGSSERVRRANRATPSGSAAPDASSTIEPPRRASGSAGRDSRQPASASRDVR